LPIVTASAACQKLRPNADTASTPTKIVANSRLGDVHVQNSCRGVPCLSASATGSIPPGSTFTIFSPYMPGR
jgi:hypothetical protein